MMNDRLQELLDSAARAARQVSASASDAAYGVGKRASELLSVGKLNTQIMSLRGEVDTALREVGELIYATHTGDPTDSNVLLEKLGEIDALNARIDALSAELTARKGAPAKVCPVCGAAAQDGDIFCRSCGARL